MQFNLVQLNNFMSYHDQKFEGLDTAGLVLIEGKNLDEGDSNGSGKSSVWDAISWALFGQTVRGLKNDEVVNRKYGKDCEVYVGLELDGKDTYVHRYRAHTEYGNRLIIHIEGGERVELGTTAQTQDWLLGKLGIDFELFRCTVLFAQGETFNFVNASNKQQKEILAKVMRVDFSDHLQATKEKVRGIETEVSEIARKLDILQSHIVDNPSELYRDEQLEWEANNVERIAKYENEVAEWQADAEAIVIKPVDKAIEIKDKLKATLVRRRGQLDALQKQKSDCDGQVAFWKKELALAQSLKDKCITCRQTVAADHASKLVEKCKLELDKNSPEGLVSGITGIKADIDATEAKLEKLDEVILKAQRDVDTVRLINARIRTHRKTIDEIKSQENPFDKKRKEALAKQKEIKTKMVDLNGGLKKIERDLPYYRFWIEGFGDSGIKSFIFDLICSTLTNQANKYLNILTNGSVTIAFDTQKKLKTGEYREKFDCVIVTEGQRVIYDAYSGGEKRRISLAVDMALSDLMSDYHSSKFNIVVFDEQTSYMDRSGRESFMKLLRELSREKKVFVVDHDSEFKAQFDQVLTIEKRGGVSMLMN